jgi:hypothetical protein
MHRSRVRFVALVLVVPVVLGACSGGGGGGKVSAEDYASSVCTHVKGWLDQIKGRVGDLQKAVSPSTSPSDGKELIRSYLDGVISDTDNMINAIKDTGTPDVPNGDKIASTLVSGLEQARSTFQDARDEADSLPTDSRASFASAAQQLGTSINSKVSGVEQAFQGINSPELDRAFNKASACQGT